MSAAPVEKAAQDTALSISSSSKQRRFFLAILGGTAALLALFAVLSSSFNETFSSFAMTAAASRRNLKTTDPVVTVNTNNSPILLLGMPKSGSEAIHHFLQCMRPDWQSQHYCCDGSNKTHFGCQNGQTCGKCVHDNWLHDRPAFLGCGKGKDVHVYAQFDVETQEPFEWFLPQHFCLPLLHRDYPEALWILNTRDTEKWATNVRHWYTTNVRIFNSFGINYQPSLPEEQIHTDLVDDAVTQDVLYHELERSLDRARNTTLHQWRLHELQQIYEQHTVKVRDFARNYHRSNMLIEVNVDDTNTAPYALLVQRLGLDPTKAKDCWTYDAKALDNDWQDFRLKV